MVLELASLEKKKEERKKERKRFSIFSKFVFSASIKLSGNQRTYLYSGGSGLSIDIHFVDIELSYDVLSPLPSVLSKHFNHPHPYIEIATAISDKAEPNIGPLGLRFSYSAPQHASEEATS